MKIWEIDDAIERLVDPETGELKDYDAFAALNMERNRKIEGMAVWVKNLTAEAKMLREEEKALAARRKVAENRAERLEAYLMRITGAQPFKSTRVQIGFRSSQRLNVFNTAAAVKWLEDNGFGDLVKYSEPTVSAEEVKKLLKTVEHIPGCAIEASKNINIK